ncbi:isoniazid-induced dynamin-like GTPase IniC [Actinoallomurus acanthiterrae]
MTLRDRLSATFETARSRLGEAPALAPARHALDLQAAAMAEPLRVALIGRVSSGKSTLANALIGGYLAPTGVAELTYNVNWIHHAPESSLTVHFRDPTRPPERRDLIDLEALAVRARTVDDPAQARFFEQISYLYVTDPSPYLKSFDLIDTPGLDSIFGDDALSTLRLLARTGEDVRNATISQVATSDALILVFARGLHGTDQDVLAGFQTPGTAGPLNTIGALTKIELYWDPRKGTDPIEVGQRVAEQIMSRPEARRLLYRLVPVAGLMGAAAMTMDATEHADLVELARLAPDRLVRRVRRGPSFATGEFPDVAVSAPRRAALLRRFSGYGIVLACELIRAGVCDVEELRTELYDRSGLSGFRRLLVEHFGGRTDLLKLNRICHMVLSLPQRLAPRLSGQDRATLTAAVGDFMAILQREEGLSRELKTLRDHYEGLLDLNEADVEEMLRVTGERGSSIRDRLGLPATATWKELAAFARDRLSHWAALGLDPGYSGPTRTAIRVVRRAYDRLVEEIDALDHATSDDDD